jgi:hypothetical protein
VGLWLRLDRGDGERFSSLLGDEDAVLVRGERSAAQLAHVLR